MNGAVVSRLRLLTTPSLCLYAARQMLIDRLGIQSGCIASTTQDAVAVGSSTSAVKREFPAAPGVTAAPAPLPTDPYADGFDESLLPVLHAHAGSWITDMLL